MTTFRLFVDSSTGVDIFPEYSMKEKSVKVETRHRARDGSEYVYKWGDIGKVDTKLTYVTSATMSQVNSWWGGNIDLFWMEEGGIFVTSVRLVNKSKPIDQFQKPYDTLFRGKIQLGTY